MAQSSVIKHYTDGTITLLDGTGTPLTLAVRFSVGDVKLDGLKAKQKETVVYQARGEVTSKRHTDRIFPTLSWSCQVADMSETSVGTVSDFITAKSGTPYASRVSTGGSSAEVFTCDCKLTVEGTNHGDSADQTWTAEDWEPTFGFGEGGPNMFTLTGPVYGAITGALAIAVSS